jgi:nucleotidyltransferase substrate binding protein (TIGR01987 family)
MELNTHHLARCIQTLESSMAFYEKATDETDKEVFRNAIVKGFELTQETSFKLLKKALRDFGHGAKMLDATSIKDILRMAATHGLMTVEEVERWFAYRDNRNDTAHDYGERFAKETLRLLPGFVADTKTLEAVLRSKYGKKG